MVPDDSGDFGFWLRLRGGSGDSSVSSGVGVSVPGMVFTGCCNTFLSSLLLEIPALLTF
jgi:hypothetical protein